MKYVIATTKMKSRALRALSEKLSSELGYRVYLVRPERVRNRNAISFGQGIDKITQLKLFTNNNVSCPKFATNAIGIGEFNHKYVVARKLTRSSGGKGIHIFVHGEDAIDAPLYTEYIPKQGEFRVHVWNGKVIDVSQKRRRRGNPSGADTKIRNLANGYVYCRGDMTEPTELRDLACRAVKALGRTSGAVDVIWNAKENRCYVLEVNANPGLEGTTLIKYVNAILENK